MASLNKILIIGNLTRDPEVSYMPSGKAVANVSIATSEKWRDKQSGEMKEQTEFHRVTFFDKLAEIVGEYAKKGAPLYVEGSLHYRKYQDKQTGADKYVTEIKASSMQLLGGKQEGRQAPAQQAPVTDGFEDTDLPF